MQEVLASAKEAHYSLVHTKAQARVTPVIGLAAAPFALSTQTLARTRSFPVSCSNRLIIQKTRMKI